MSMGTKEGSKGALVSAYKFQVAEKKVEISTKTFKCNFCDYKTNQSSALTNHTRVHTREKPYKCQHSNCKAAFTSAGHLKRHQLVHNKGDESLYKFKCSTCSYKCGLNSHLNQHLKTHSDVKEFACDLCLYRAKQKGHIKAHHNRVHSIEKLYKCPQPDCQYSFKANSDLTNHLKVHSNDRPFVCSFVNCEFKTKWKMALKIHEMAHRGEKPFKCSFCTFCCSDNSALVRHIRGHTGERPYPCQKCSYRALSSSKLTEHVKGVHRDEKKSRGAFASMPLPQGRRPT